VGLHAALADADERGAPGATRTHDTRLKKLTKVVQLLPERDVLPLKMGVPSGPCRPVMGTDVPLMGALMGALMGKGAVPVDDHGKS